MVEAYYTNLVVIIIVLFIVYYGTYNCRDDCYNYGCMNRFIYNVTISHGYTIVSFLEGD
jgi:hypothetical protein